MDGNVSGDEYENIDWDTEDELEIQNIPVSSSSSSHLATRNVEAIFVRGEASSSKGPSSSNMVQHFLGMGFSERLIEKAIKETGEGKPESAILEAILTYSVLEDSPDQPNSSQFDSPQPRQCANADNWSSDDCNEDVPDDLSDSDWSGEEIAENASPSSGREKMLSDLVRMGYTVEEASIAMARCGPEALIGEVTDFICAAQMAKTADASYQEHPEVKKQSTHYFENGRLKKRKLHELEALKKMKQKGLFDEESSEAIKLPVPMIGFGVPTEGAILSHRNLPEAARGPPFFYYENVALAPKGVWDTISRSLYDVEPEFVDSKFFCAANRKRGYIHNLPIANRFPILPLPPRTIKDAFPLTKKWWPHWDKREKLNCLQTAYASAKLTERIRKALEKFEDDPPAHVQKYVLDECRKWNLIWLGKNKVAPLEPDEVEMLLGFPRNHTRGGGINRTDRYKSLGNSFQVDTVAYHLSVVKEMFPKGINLLSLFSGIGGAEVALNRLGVRLNNVVSVEISEVNRNIMKSWWEQTNQTGNLIHFDDIQQVDAEKLQNHMDAFGGFDLVVGGSPCNNLAGSNRVSRDGLEGDQSSLFYEFPRILEIVRIIMGVGQ